MSTSEIILVVILAVVFLFCIVMVIFLFMKNKKNNSNKGNESCLNTNNVNINDITMQLFQMNKTLEEKLNENISQRFDQTNKNLVEYLNLINNQNSILISNQIKLLNEKISNVISSNNIDIKSNLDSTKVAMDKIKDSVSKLEETKNKMDKLNDQMVRIEDIFTNNAKRGKFGEFSLKTLIQCTFGEVKNVYAFQNEIVNTGSKYKPDATIYMPENKQLFIDSKFPFTDFNEIYNQGEQDIQNNLKFKEFKSNLRKRITEVTKYTQYSNFPYVLMYIPSDSILMFINNYCDNIVNYSYQSNVILVSPSTLQPILFNIKEVIARYNVNENAEKIIEASRVLIESFNKMLNNYNILKKNLNAITTRNILEIDKQINSINKSLSELESLQQYDSNEINKEIESTNTNIDLNIIESNFSKDDDNNE